MTDPILESVATALTTQAVTALGSAGKQALDKIRELVRSKADDDPETGAALEAASTTGAGTPEVAALAERLDYACQQDHAFADRLRKPGEIVHNQITANNGGVVNHISGNVEKAIQTNHIEGGVTFN